MHGRNTFSEATSLYRQHCISVLLSGFFKKKTTCPPKGLNFFKTVLTNKKMGLRIFEPKKTNNNRASSVSFREIWRVPFRALSIFGNRKRTRNSYLRHSNNRVPRQHR